MNTSSVLFSDLAMRWKESKRSVVKHSTYCAYTLILKTHLIPYFGNHSCISEAQVQEFVFEKLNSGLSRKSVHDILAVLSAVCKYGAKHTIFQKPDWDIVYPSETKARSLPVLSIANHRKLLAYISANPNPQNIGVLLALCCGLRIGEVCALRWDNVDLVHRTITVSATTGRIYNCETMGTEYYTTSPKTKSSNREIPISSLLLEALRKVKKQQVGHDYVVGNGYKAKEPRTYRETFSRMLKRLNIPPIVFHGLRHTFATRCIESQCDYKTVSVILGHSNIATTLNLYVHPNLDQKKRCIDKLEKYIGLKQQVSNSAQPHASTVEKPYLSRE